MTGFPGWQRCFVPSRLPLLLAFAGLFAALLATAGCLHAPLTAVPATDSERDKDLDVRTIGEITEVANAGPLAVSGVGLVTGLSGTGHSPTGEFRGMLENELRKQKVEHVKQLLDSPDNALVLVSGGIRAGARKGDTFDLEISLPPGSKATSLAGGYLQTCMLRNYEMAKNINPEYQGGNKLLSGHIFAHGSGLILVGANAASATSEEGVEGAEVRRGRIWSGATSHIDRPFFLVMTKEAKSARFSNAVAQRINVMFADDAQKRAQLLKSQNLLVLDEMTEKLNRQFGTPTPGTGNVAGALNKDVVQCNVPFAYRFNPERYLRVARLIPLTETPEQMSRYRLRLQKMVLDPQESVRAALRLEALGKDSVPALKEGLKNDQPLVKFCCAESLAYLGNVSGCDTLARMAEDQPALRHWCLLALGSLEESVPRRHLAVMLGCPHTQVRCGAFQALRQMDDSDRNLRGAPVGQAFWLHTVAPDSPPLVYYATRQRPEIVLFGSKVRLAPPAKVLAGPEFTVTAEPGDERCTISRFLKQGTIARRQCSLQLDDVLRTLVELGGQYPDAIDLLNKLSERRCLTCPVCNCSVLPQEVSVTTLAENARDPEFLSRPGDTAAE
ncbi:MAG: hypothetical protein FJ271_19235 [Planctomycetes bacterium]|nr:hypothetical protein [Planctomycetota bacterium]